MPPGRNYSNLPNGMACCTTVARDTMPIPPQGSDMLHSSISDGGCDHRQKSTQQQVISKDASSLSSLLSVSQISEWRLEIGRMKADLDRRIARSERD